MVRRKKRFITRAKIFCVAAVYEKAKKSATKVKQKLEIFLDAVKFYFT